MTQTVSPILLIWMTMLPGHFRGMNGLITCGLIGVFLESRVLLCIIKLPVIHFIHGQMLFFSCDSTLDLRLWAIAMMFFSVILHLI